MSRAAGRTRGARRWRRPASLLVLALGLGLAAWAVASGWTTRRGGPSARHVQAAHRAWSQGRLDEAAAELARAQKKGEPDDEVQRLWGLVYARAGRPDDALPMLRHAWDQPGDPAHRGDPEVAEALARILMQRFELAEASAVLDRWARAVLSDATPVMMQVEIDRRIGLDSRAIIDRLREVLRRDPTQDKARLGLAQILFGDARYSEAAGLYAAYAAAHPDDPAGHLGVAITARAQGEMDQAIAALDRALALTPEDTLALKERAAIDLIRGHPQQGLVRLDRAIAADPFDPELRYQRSLALIQLGRRDEAVAERVRSTKLRLEHTEMEQIADQLLQNPTDNGLRYRAARWMFEHGRAEEGAEWARLVLHDQPDHPEANRLLADYHRSRGELGLVNFYQMRLAPAPGSAGAQSPTGPGPGSNPVRLRPSGS
jgi:tetratricopeptide (TPR) repeat protein